MNPRHPAFRNNEQPSGPFFDTHPQALTAEEVEHIRERLKAGCAPKARLISKMLRLCAKVESR